MRELFAGVTSVTQYVVLRNSTTGLGLAGKAFGDVTGSYTRNRAARTAITMATLASASAAWSSGGFVEVDATNCPGLYRFDIPDAAFATGVDKVIASVKVAGAIEEHLEFQLTSWNKQVASIPNAAAGRTGGLPTVMQGNLAVASTGTTITLDSTLTVDRICNGQQIFIVGGTGIGQVRTIVDYVGSTNVATINRPWRTNPDTTSVYNLAGPETAPWPVFQSGVAQSGGATTIQLSTSAGTTDSIYNGLRINLTGNTGAAQTRTIVGYVGATRTATVDHAWATNPDSTTVYAILADNGLATDGGGNLAGLTASAVALIWNALTSGLTTVGSVGKRIADNLDALITSRLSPTVAGRTLDVAATGEAGLDFNNINDAGSGHTLTNIRVPNVTLADTVTTYTGNTPQSGDNFARLGAPAGASVSADIASVQADTDNLQTRVPTALVSGRMDSSVGAYASGQAPLQPTVAGRTLDVAATGEAGLDFDNVHDATVAHTLTNITVPVTTSLSSGERTSIADALLDRDLGAGADTVTRSVRNALRFLRNKWSVAAGVVTVTKEDDSTTAWTANLTQTPGANPITGSDPN